MKKLISMLLLISIVLCFCSCGIEKVQSGLPEKSAETTVRVTEEMWIEAYREYLENAVSEEQSEDGYDSITSTQFGVYNVDGDDIPELLVSNGTYHASTVVFVTFIDGKIVESERTGSSGVVAFVEGEGKVIGNYYGMGSDSYTFYNLVNGQLELIWYGERFTDITNDNRVTCCSYTEEVDEETYYSLLEENMPENITANGDWETGEYEVQGRPMITATEKNIALYFDALLAGDDAECYTDGDTVYSSGKARTISAYWDTEAEEDYDIVYIDLDEPFVWCKDCVKKPTYEDLMIVDCLYLDIEDTGNYNGEEMSVRGDISYSEEFGRTYLKDTNIIESADADEEITE